MTLLIKDNKAVEIGRVKTLKAHPMKRTQSKAVKPARKGAVKVPKVLLRCPACHRTKVVKREDYDEPDAIELSLRCPKCDNGGGFNESTTIRRNPRAARANKGRKV